MFNKSSRDSIFDYDLNDQMPQETGAFKKGDYMSYPELYQYSKTMQLVILTLVEDITKVFDEVRLSSPLLNFLNDIMLFYYMKLLR